MAIKGPEKNGDIYASVLGKVESVPLSLFPVGNTALLPTLMALQTLKHTTRWSAKGMIDNNELTHNLLDGHSNFS